MISCNALMLTTFTKGMQTCRSTAEAVVVNNATNFILTVRVGMTNSACFQCYVMLGVCFASWTPVYILMDICTGIIYRITHT